MIILFLCLGTACGPKDYDFQNHKFDQQVIEKLPVYDNLSKDLLKYYPSIQDLIMKESVFRYMISWDTNYLYKNLPAAGARNIKQYLTQLGENFIYGFEAYKDSTIKILIRDTYLEPYRLHVRERLSFYPTEVNTKKREFDYKDTTLNRNWQYWIWFDEDGLF